MRVWMSCMITAVFMSACGTGAVEQNKTSSGIASFHNEGWASALAGESGSIAGQIDATDTVDTDASGHEETEDQNRETADIGDHAGTTIVADGDDGETGDPAARDEAGAKTDAEDSSTDSTESDDSDTGETAEEAAAESDGSWSITLVANDGSDTQDVVAADADGESVTLPANEFSREGYIFRGWGLARSQADPDYSDMDTVEDTSVTVLYAMWEPQMYMIAFDGNGADYGETEGMYALYNANAFLSRNGFRKNGYKFTGWKDAAGNTYEDQEKIRNLNTGDTNCQKVIQVDAGKPLDEEYSFRSTQGSCVYVEDGVTYFVTTASINDAAYNKGDLSHYETILNKYNLDTGELVASKRNLQFDHGNSICYNEDNRHLYIAEGGTLAEYPGGVMEVDENLEEVAEYTFPLLDHIWAIAYDGEHFYVLGKNEQSRNTLCTLNEEMKTLSFVELDDYYTQFSSQGIGADENYIYAVSAGFKTYEWKTKQRINVFTHEGTYVGVWTIDVQDEAEDITILDGCAYISTNEKNKSTLYRTELPVVTLTAMWTKK